MSTFYEIKDLIEKTGRSFEEYKRTNDERLEAIKNGKETEAKELGKKLEKIDNDLTKLTELKASVEREMEFQRERVEALEAKATNPKKTAAEKIQEEYKGAFESWVRARGEDNSLSFKLQELSKKAQVEGKAVTIGSSSGGGYAVPEEIARQIELLELKFSPVRRLVKVVKTNSSDYKELVSLRGASAGWVGEGDSRSATSTPLLREVVPTHGELYAYPQASEWALDDIFFNVEEWLANEVAQEFAQAEGIAVISGNGTSKPTGMTNTTPVTTADFASPLRAAAAYQYVASDLDADGSPAGIGIRGDSLIDLVYTLNSAYRQNATFVMNSTTAGAVRKLKDENGQYHWAPGLANGQPNTLLGYPVETWEDMADVGANNFPIAFGDFKRGYLLVDRVGLRITRDNVTNPGHIRFYVRRREGGMPLNNDAIKFLRTVQ